MRDRVLKAARESTVPFLLLLLAGVLGLTMIYEVKTTGNVSLLYSLKRAMTSAFVEQDWALILVNRLEPLGEEYPVQLQKVSDIEVDRRIAKNLENLLEAAKSEGIELITISGYRSFEKSEELYRQKVSELVNSGYRYNEAVENAGLWVALPGESEHNTGLSVDLVSREYYNRYQRYLDTQFESFKGYDWLIAHSWEYGFILRYPKGAKEITGINYEPWHYRYVGRENARAIALRNITLEEYLLKRG